MGKLPFPNSWDRASSSFWGYLLLRPLDLESPRRDARADSAKAMGSHQSVFCLFFYSYLLSLQSKVPTVIHIVQEKIEGTVSKRRQRKENPSTSLTVVFNLCMDPLVEVICQDGVWYHQYTSILQIRESSGLDWEKRFQLNPSKTMKLWVLNSPGFGDFLSFAFIGLSVSHTELVHTSKNFLDL